MQNQNPTNAESKIVSGKTKVSVKKLIVSEGKDSIQTIHVGRVIAQNSDSSWLRVYSKENGDTSPDNAEWFPRQSKLCWCEITA